MRLPILLLLPLSLAACSGAPSGRLQGYVEGDYMHIAAPLAGRITSIAVVRGSDVAAGAPLFALDTVNEQAAVAEAHDHIDSAQARLDDLKKGRRPEEIGVARAQLRQADAERDLAAAQLKRQSGLQQKGLISADQLDQARTQAAASAAHARELEHQLRVSQLAARPDEIAAASQDVKAAEAQLAQAQWSLAQKSVVAPAAGRIEEVYYRVGEFAAAGAPVVSLLPPQNRKLRLFVPETELGRVHAGMTVRVSCDGCGAPFSASIRFIASAAEFTPPVLYDRSQRARLVYLVEAYPQEQDALRLHPGQPVDIELPHG